MYRRPGLNGNRSAFPDQVVPVGSHPNRGRPRPRPLTPQEVARAFGYYQTHTQRETAAFFGISQSTVGCVFRRVFGANAVRDAEATWQMKRARHLSMAHRAA